ncbi:SpoIIE family protein phosphatase [Isoptericola sp. NPDC057653]|uniref:SpoIIE family protein phosphatase n=1 Tax=Isoptericola sp. NPDC057653 TaxID=3346195 RepID=UPI0036AEF0DD
MTSGPGSAATDATTIASEAGVWHTVDHASAVGAVRRAATTAATRLGLGDARAAEAGLVVSELATNQSRHAGSGSVLLRVRRWDGHAALEVLAVDAGPGMRDLGAAMRDGVSSRGTLGIGLGTLPRLTTTWDAWSSPGQGTVVAATFASPGARPDPAEPAGLVRAMTGQPVSGDAHAIRHDAGATTVLVADGLGHGPLAAAASQAAVRAFLDGPDAGPSALLGRVHAALGGTRGAAVAVARAEGGTLRYAGLGNIVGSVQGAGRPRSLLSQPGIAGTHTRTVRETTLPLDAGDLLLMHSDGLTDRTGIGGYPRVADAGPLVVAGLLMRDFAVRRDDACVVVAPVGARP